MTKLHIITSEIAMDSYRSETTGERLGWVIFSHPSAFTPVHLIHMHPEDGPVVILLDEVWEVDPGSDPVYSTEDEARDKYWESKC